MTRNRGSMMLLISFLLTACVRTPTTISGSVRDQEGPIAGAIVRVQGTDRFITTDQDGTFTLAGLTPDQAVILTAWASGYYIAAGEAAYQPGETVAELLLVPHSQDDSPDYEWLSAYSHAGLENNCQNCHADADDPGSALPFDEWRLDAHSKSAQNVRFLTMYSGTDVYGNQSPLTCRGSGRDYGSFPLPPDSSQPYYGPGFQLDFPGTAGNCAACHAPAASVQAPYATDPTAVSGVGSEGVTCDFCHKVWDVKLDDSGMPFPNMPGVLSYDLRRPEEGHQFFAGPFDDVAPGEDTYSPLQQESQFCAPCHYGVFWDTVVYNSYGEWLQSDYSDPESGKTCQNCHMPAGLTDHFTRLDGGGLVRDAETIFSHRMPGAQDEQLLKNAVSVSIETRREAGEIVVQVAITNDNTGHHVPTDSPLRHLILVVQAEDGAGIALTQSGGPTIPDWGGIGEASEGYYAGLPGTIYAKILQEVWTRIYPSGAYWNPTRVLQDNRIPALETDTTTYRFAAVSQGQVSVEVSLIYRRAFIDLRDQKGWDAPDIVIAAHRLIVD